MGKLYLGIDQGTTVTTALLLNEQWQVVGRGQKEHRRFSRSPVGWSMILSIYMNPVSKLCVWLCSGTRILKISTA